MARPLKYPFNEVTEGPILVRGKDVPNKWKRYANRHGFVGVCERQSEPVDVVAELGPLYMVALS